MAKDRTNFESDDPAHTDLAHSDRAHTDRAHTDATSEASGSAQNGEPADASDEKSRRAARLAAIKKAVDAGDYDSDELLEIALKKMIQGLPSDRDDE